jgi:hypothetical protein
MEGVDTETFTLCWLGVYILFHKFGPSLIPMELVSVDMCVKLLCEHKACNVISTNSIS